MLSTRISITPPGPMIPPTPAILLSINGLEGEPDEISVLWTFVLNGYPAKIGVSAELTHRALGLIDKHGEFVLNVPTEGMVEPFDKIDMNSSKVGDKFVLSGLTRGNAQTINAPTIEESPIHLECRVFNRIPLPPGRVVFFADVLATSVANGVCDVHGRLVVPNVPFFGMTAGSGEFYTMGQRIGQIGACVGRTDIRY
jgi:flavin reductase (DIM6/NTAB) family NADH-FMN oxidoreductase RutF